MPAHKKFLVAFLIAPAIFLFSSKTVLARVVINEFNSYGSSDWVEIYRTETENLSLYYLEDDAGNKKQLSWDDCNGEFCTVDWSNILNNSGDVIKLFLAGYPLPGDQVVYGNIEGSIVNTPGEGQSAGRITDGASSWTIFSTPTKGGTNNTASPAPTNTPIPAPTPTLTPTPTTTPTSLPKATYKINEAKDRQGNVLSSVKIYVDGVYIHHYVPETINFCGGCKCDSDVDCGFGEHAIELQKTGYEDWEEGINFTAGGSFETNPVMEATLGDSTTTPTPTPTPTPKPQTPTPTKKMTPTPEVTGLVATESGEVLGENESTPTPTPLAVSTIGFSKSQLLPKILIIFGLVILFGVAFAMWYTRLR